VSPREAKDVKPIETTYKGYRFRSRLEARWAIFFDTLDLAWQYEPEGFELKTGARYLPDFKLLGTRQVPDIYVEVKACAPFPPGDARKLWDFSSELRLQGGDGGLLILVGTPGDAEGSAFMDGVFNGCSVVEELKVAEFFASVYKLKLGDLANAVNSARAARFEYGERG
jgi:hypothetical protein